MLLLQQSSFKACYPQNLVNQETESILYVYTQSQEFIVSMAEILSLRIIISLDLIITEKKLLLNRKNCNNNNNNNNNNTAKSLILTVPTYCPFPVVALTFPLPRVLMLLPAVWW